MTGFCEDAWDRIAALRAAIHDLPFNRELAAGSLPQATFQEYMIQDALYLASYSRALAAAAVKAPDSATMAFFSESAHTALIVERSLHEGFLRRFGVDPSFMNTAEPSPTCTAYTSHLLAVAHTASYEALVAAILPCFWIYWDVGVSIAKIAAPDNPYQAWIDTYTDEAFARSVDQAKAATDAAALSGPDRVEAMHGAFRRSSQFEWMFWDAAYRRETWPV